MAIPEGDRAKYGHMPERLYWEMLKGEDPDDRAIREAHGIGYEDPYDDTVTCRNGCGLTYPEISVGKVRACAGDREAELQEQLDKIIGPGPFTADWRPITEMPEVAEVLAAARAASLTGFIAARLDEQAAAASSSADPARVMREVATWRAILAEHAASPRVDDDRFRAGFSNALGFVLQQKAGEYSDHPDWQPDGAWPSI